MSDHPVPVGTTAAESYDAVPYESHAIGDTSPDTLAAMGTLFGVHPAPVETCRVLELGCAGAANLCAMALPLPGARFFGIDASPRQIEEGRSLAQELGIGNLELVAADFQQPPPDLPEFDYIVCHGVYSWISPEAQTKLLELIGRHLAPQGIAYLSYNTYPGGHLRLMAREMMRFHVRHLEDPEEKTNQARAILAMLKRFAATRPGPYEKVLEYLGGHLENEPDWYVFHEYLEEHNEPVYFSDLVGRAARHGLQYLAPARFIPWEHRLPPEAGAVPRLADRVVREQYLDFLCNRMFRRTLFCRAGLPIADEPRVEALEGLRAYARATPVDPVFDPKSDREEEFSSGSGENFRSSHPHVKAILAALADEAPRIVPVPELRRLADVRLGKETPAEELGSSVLRLHVSNVVALRTWPGAHALSPGERPRASPLARWQAARDQPAVNLRHEMRELSDLDALIVPLLDGTRDRAILREAVLAAVAEGKIGIEDAEGERLQEPEAVREFVAAAVDECLGRLAATCFLTA